MHFLLGPTMGVCRTRRGQQGLGFLLEDLMTPIQFSDFISTEFLVRILLVLIGCGFDVRGPRNIRFDSLGFFFMDTVNVETVKALHRYE